MPTGISFYNQTIIPMRTMLTKTDCSFEDIGREFGYSGRDVGRMLRKYGIFYEDGLRYKEKLRKEKTAMSERRSERQIESSPSVRKKALGTFDALVEQRRQEQDITYF